jgi:hypothetical protein
MPRKTNNQKGLQEAIKYFSDPDNALAYMVKKRWPDGVVTCPTCGRQDPVFLKNQRKWQCKAVHAKRQFSAKVGTVFEDSPIPLEKWLVVVWMLSNCRNGVSSYEIARAISVTQKSAWFMLHRIRVGMKVDDHAGFGGNGGEVEADETFVGGLSKNMHSKRRAMFRIARETSMTGDANLVNKTPVMAVLDREQRKIRATVVSKVNRESLQEAVLNHVAHGSKIYTDEAKLYRALPREYIHEFVNHMENYVSGRVHTNGLENFWSLLKRGLRGTYVAVEPFHLSRYVDEQAFRYNHRKHEDKTPITDEQRFSIALSQVVNKRLTYAELTGKVGENQTF